MNFTEKINLIFNHLDLKNTEIAKRASLDPSLLSHFRCGKRIPSQRNTQIQKICDAIIEYSILTKKQSILFQLSLYPQAGNEMISLSKWLSFWLLHDYADFDTVLKNLNSEYDYNDKAFGEKLNLIMTMLEISNRTLANSINVDSSLISRLKRGARTTSNKDLIRLMSSYFYEKAKQNNQLDHFQKIVNPTLTSEMDSELLYKWFLAGTQEHDVYLISSLFTKINNFSMATPITLPSIDKIIDPEIIKKDQSIYHGVNGLREAVIRFLNSVIQTDAPTTLYLYSDQNMDWMTSDAEFSKIWATLMAYILKNNNKIVIIHNINRDLKELLEAITRWLPLYMSGLIESYYLDNEQPGPFRHTMFIAPAVGAITSDFIRGHEKNAQYNYHTGILIDYPYEQFTHLLSIAKPFVKMYPSLDIIGIKSLQDKATEIIGDTKIISSSPSIATMSPELFREILDRNKIDDVAKIWLINYHRSLIAMITQLMKNGLLIEYVYCPDFDEAYNQIPLYLSGMHLSKELFYTRDEYQKHIQEMDQFAHNSENYRYIKLSSNPFPSMYILVNKARMIVIKKSETTMATFLGHPTITKTYYNYLEKLISDHP